MFMQIFRQLLASKRKSEPKKQKTVADILKEIEDKPQSSDKNVQLKKPDKAKPKPKKTVKPKPTPKRMTGAARGQTKTAKRPKYLRKSTRKIHTAIVHSTATKRGRNVSKADLHKWHVKERGWSDIGYHGMIHRDGSFEACRSIDKDGAHAVRHNRNTIGIVMVGGLGDNMKAENNFTKAQFATLRKVVLSLEQQYRGIKIIGHRDTGKSTACPSFNVIKWWRENGSASNV